MENLRMRVRGTTNDKETQFILSGENIWDEFKSQSDKSMGGVIMVYRCSTKKELWVAQSHKGCVPESENGFSVILIPMEFVNSEPVQEMFLTIEHDRGVSLNNFDSIKFHAPQFHS